MAANNPSHLTPSGMNLRVESVSQEYLKVVTEGKGEKVTQVDKR